MTDTDWRHINNPYAGVNACLWDSQPWPCDAERMRLRAEAAEKALAKASEIAEWIGTDIEDYEHGGRDADYEGWRASSFAICDIDRALTQPASKPE